jgi:hypothetical protein
MPPAMPARVRSYRVGRGDVYLGDDVEVVVRLLYVVTISGGLLHIVTNLSN